MKRTCTAASALAAVAFLSAGAASPLDRPREPTALRGVPLHGTTGLRLVVADKPPFVLDVDRGSVAPVRAVPTVKRGVLWVVGVGGRAAVVGVASAWRRAGLYAVRGRGARVSYLGTGSNVWPVRGGRAVWVQGLVGRSRCTLREVALDGRVLRAPRAFPCATASDPAGGSLGLVVHRTRLVDPLTARTVHTTRWGILAAAGTKLLLAGPGRRLTLLDTETGARRSLRSPAPFAEQVPGASVDPRGRLVALSYGNPAWGTRQVLDVWLLDATTGKLSQLPGMPAFVSLKYTNMAWTDDGRLVLVAQSDGTDIVAVWRPGRPRLALKIVQLPERGDSGSDTFAPIR